MHVEITNKNYFFLKGINERKKSFQIKVDSFFKNFLLIEIYSNTLINTIANTRNYIYSLQGALQDHQVFAISFPELASTISIIRSRNLNFTPSNPKEYTKDYVCMLCPVVDLMNHDFENNSYIQGKIWRKTIILEIIFKVLILSNIYFISQREKN